MRRSIMAVFGLVAAVGCSDLEGPDVNRVPGLSQDPGFTQHGSTETLTRNMAARKWFSISIEPTTSLKPDEPIELVVTYTANFATDDADLFVVLPEIESAKLSSWGDGFKMPLGGSIPIKVESNQGFVAGDQTSQSVAFSVPVPGIYRVHATARSNKVRPEETSELTIQSAHKSLWLLVDEDGGRTMRTFDADAISDDYMKQPGPFRKNHGGKQRPADDGSAKDGRDAGIRTGSGAALSRACGSNHICVQLVYVDADVPNDPQPVPGVAYEYAFIDPQTGYEEWSTSGFADSNGEFEVACPGPNDDFRGSLSFNSASVRIIPRTTSALTLGYCGEDLQIQMASLESRTWTNAYHSIPNSRDMFYNRAKIDIEVNYSDADGGCNYLLVEDYIRLYEDEDEGCIWENYGWFVLPHEYGHALHDTRLGGIPPLSGCSPHAPDDPSNLACAYAEGWADYHGFITQGEVYEGLLPGSSWFTEAKIEDNHYLQNNEDGSIDEGVVAAFFYDLVDPAGEAGDDIDLSGDNVSRVMNRCKVRVGAWARPNGIDHLIWCLEAAVFEDITDDDDYFPTRTTDPNDQNQSNHSWDEDDIRKLWLKVLYGEDS
ncbi:hypothetical protein [Candidatus Palauibacter sp.]|uniref:hypothetical protein n=1 Tax=Candidatus Palauibacter sp. TaxID=3101350 RepID=UPI003B02078E